MSQFIQAIYEHGVFRPLDPVELTEHERVSLLVSEVAESNQANTSKTKVADTLQQQREVLAKLRAEMESLPLHAPQDGLGGADHDLILYGWQK